jgi:[ribosomal protein S18]-alanine N-acetyltransferase
MKEKGFSVQVCPISTADVVEVKSLEQECDLSPWSVNNYYAEVNRVDSLALVAKVEGKVIGFVIARLIRISNQPSISDIEIYNICISSRNRRMGIGQSLIDELIKLSGNRVNSIWLEVRESNEQAISFYKKSGFKTMGTRNNFYSHPTENGLIMKKSFA